MIVLVKAEEYVSQISQSEGFTEYRRQIGLRHHGFRNSKRNITSFLCQVLFQNGFERLYA